MTGVIEAQNIKVIRPKALIYRDKKPAQISAYGRVMLYPVRR